VFEGFLNARKLGSVKTTIDIPDDALADAMRFTGAKTKREAVVKALEDYNRRNRVDEFIKKYHGAFPEFPGKEETEAVDVLDAEQLAKEIDGR
jgi:Arc/MetJ family transcription regulator